MGQAFAYSGQSRPLMSATPCAFVVVVCACVCWLPACLRGALAASLWRLVAALLSFRVRVRRFRGTGEVGATRRLVATLVGLPETCGSLSSLARECAMPWCSVRLGLAGGARPSHGALRRVFSLSRAPCPAYFAPYVWDRPRYGPCSLFVLLARICRRHCSGSMGYGLARDA